MVVIASSLSWESMNCFQWRIFMRRFWASAVRRSLRLRGCSGGNWGERGRVWGCTVLLGRWDLFCQWWRTRQQPEQFCVKQECAFFWASWGGGFLWRHTLLGVGASRALFFCCFPPKEKPTRAGSRRTPRHKDNNKNKTAGNLNDSLRISLWIYLASLISSFSYTLQNVR